MTYVNRRYRDDQAGYLARFLNDYEETAGWAEESPDRGDFIPDFVLEAELDCRDFVRANWQLLRCLDPGMAAHDFYLTRNRHGAGYWDRGLGILGDLLTAAAHVYGEHELSEFLPESEQGTLDSDGERD